MNLRKSVTSVVLIVILLGVAGLIAWGLYSTRTAPERSNLERPAPLVEVLTVVAEDVRERFLGYGSARADQSVTVAAHVSGEVIALEDGLNDGSPVEKGQFLVQIDDRDYLRQLERVQSLAEENQAQIDLLDVELANIEELLIISKQEVELKRADFNRINELFEKRSANQQDFDAALLSLQQMRREFQRLQNIRNLIAPRRTALIAAKQARLAEAEQAQLDLDRCRITAAFSGQVDRLHVNVGDRLGIGSQVLGLVSLEQMEIPVELPVSVRPRVELGAQVRLTVDSMPQHSWTGKLNRIAPAADLQSRTFAGYVMVDNQQQRLPMMPGYFLKAEVEGPMLENALVVPRDIIVQGVVYVVNDDHAHLRKVNVERYIGDRAVVTGELKDGDQIILTNLDLLYEGATVRTVEVDGEEMKIKN